MLTCINVFVQIYTSAYFNMGLFTKALEITWAKPMYMKHIFLCEGGMHLLKTGFASIGYLHGRQDSENCFLNLSLSAVCDCGICWSHSYTFLIQCKTKAVWKRV